MLMQKLPIKKFKHFSIIYDNLEGIKYKTFSSRFH
jgi:hypothetical protein